MTVTVRFAPSPTGRLHVGNFRTALLNMVVAQKEKGRFILRIDDTDTERSEKRFEDAIHADIAWMGMTPAEVVHQSARFDRYNAAVEKLKELGRLYPAYETPDELERKRRLQLARRQPPVYDRAALKLTDEEKAKLEAEGRKPHWRFLLDHGEVAFTDRVRGPVSIDTASVSDPILIREDGSYLYTLPSVVDDIDLGITLVLRGEDHVTNSALQIQIFEALGARAPQMAHVSLLVDADGGKLSKRLGSLAVGDLREQGIEAMALASYLTKLGTSDNVDIRPSLDALAEEFSFDKMGRAPARFSEEELWRLNADYLHDLDYETVAGRLKALGVHGDAAFWEAVRANIQKLADAHLWWQVVEGPVTPEIDDPDFAAQAAALLPDGPLDGESWSAWTAAVKETTGRKGKHLFMPLRHALTGQARGPEMAVLLPLIGAEKARARLRGERA